MIGPNTSVGAMRYTMCVMKTSCGMNEEIMTLMRSPVSVSINHGSVTEVGARGKVRGDSNHGAAP
jgi:hypothetical protein